ncbi:MAG: hypothetical protein ABI566_11210 [Pseudolysinimonas sp.]
MQWWNDLMDWFRTDDGQTALFSAVVLFVAIVVAGVIAALVGRGTTRRLVSQRDRETRTNAVAALVTAGKSASVWHSLTPAAKEHAEALSAAANIQVRLLPIANASLAADWAEHQLDDMRTNSVNYSFQADQTLDEYRDRLVRWLHKPGKAKKLFWDDLDRWRYDNTQPDPVALEQQRWAEEQFTAQTQTPVEHESELPLLGPTSTPAKR